MYFSILRLLAWWPAAVSAMRVAKTPTESVCPWGTDFGTTTATESEQGISENTVRKNKPEILCENSAYTSGWFLNCVCMGQPLSNLAKEKITKPRTEVLSKRQSLWF